MKKSGLCSVTFRDRTPEEIITLTQAAGLHAIEWGGDTHVPINDAEHAKRVGQRTRQAGLEVASYGSYFYAGEGHDFSPFLEAAQALQTKAIRIWAKKMDFKKEIGRIDEQEFTAVVQDIEKAAKQAQSAGISLHLECHQGTYTDTTKSAKRLMAAIDEPNVFLYWQPLAYTSKVERLEQIKELGKYISNVHVFHWDSDFSRFPLREGKREWQDYIQQVQSCSDNPHYFLMEFVKGNTASQFAEDAHTIKELLRPEEFK